MKEWTGGTNPTDRGWENDIMSGNPLAQSLATWIETTLNAPGDPGAEHCFEARPRFRIPGAGSVDLLTCRHDKGHPDRFRVDLWTILRRPLGESDADPMLRRLHAFQAWFSTRNTSMRCAISGQSSRLSRLMAASHGRASS
jgi:hypothetical protein